MRRLGMGFLTAVILCLCFVGCSTKPNVNIRINEVLTAGGDADWIELYNAGETAVNLDGCFLSDDPETLGKWMFPNIVLDAGEYLVVYADKKESTAERLSLPFSLKASGETVVLSDPNGNPLDTVIVPESHPGVSYGRTADGSFAHYASPTPNEANENGMVLGSQSVNLTNGVRINEYMTRNRSILYDSDGDYCDWIELYNFSDKAVDLSGYYLTDSEETLAKWQFPQGTTLAAGGYLIVFCSGKADKVGELHASFKLGQSDSYVGLYTSTGAFCSGVTCATTLQDQSVGYLEDGTYAVRRHPTPAYGE